MLACPIGPAGCTVAGHSVATRRVSSVRPRACAGPRLPTTALLTGSLTPKEKARIQGSLAEGGVDIVVGTHALISRKVDWARLGLAVVDEQHK